MMSRAYISIPFLFCFVLFCHSAFPQPGKSFDEYKTEIINLGKAKEFDEALRLLEKTKKKFPKEKQFQASIYYHIADGYYVTGKLEKVLALLEMVSREYPTDNAIWALYARALIKNQQKERALEILKQFPSNFGNFEEDLKRMPLDIWTKYSLAASYALLGDRDLGVLYMHSVLFHQPVKQPEDIDRIFWHFEKDPDFDSLRDDNRYLFFANAVGAETFEDASAMLQELLRSARDAVKKFSLEKASAEETAESLQDSLENLEKIKTVAPILVRIQREMIHCLEKTQEKVSVYQDVPDPPNLQQIRDYFEKRSRPIERHLQLARESQ